MIDIEYIRSFFPPAIARESRFDRYMLKEYLQLLILDHLATTPYINKVSFIGGTNLRLIQGIDRFSEDLDFDCKELGEDEFMVMTDSVVTYLRQNNINVETRDKPNPKLTAFRRNLYFPEMLFDLGLTGQNSSELHRTKHIYRRYLNSKEESHSVDIRNDRLVWNALILCFDF